MVSDSLGAFFDWKCVNGGGNGERPGYLVDRSPIIKADIVCGSAGTLWYMACGCKNSPWLNWSAYGQRWSALAVRVEGDAPLLVRDGICSDEGVTAQIERLSGLGKACRPWCSARGLALDRLGVQGARRGGLHFRI